MEQERTATVHAPGDESEPALLDQIVRAAGAERARVDLERQVAAFLAAVLERPRKPSSGVVGMVSALIADLDQVLTKQLNAIMHAPEFQQLEASWRGLEHLVGERDSENSLVKIRVLNASKADLAKDLERAIEFDQSALFRKVYEEEYGTFGGMPFGVLVGDYWFDAHPRDIALLERCGNVAAAAHAPFLAAASPALFGWESFTAVNLPRDLARIFSTNEYIKWRSFRDSEDSRYVGLILPRVLVRHPYGPESLVIEPFNFVESVDGPDSGKYLWGNPAYALAARLTESFDVHGWYAAIRGVDGGGLVDDLPNLRFSTDRGDVAPRGPTEVVVTDGREKELADLGFISLVHCKGTECAVFFSTQSCQKPKLYDTDEANANARLSTQLQYILATSRFAHYVKVMMRDKLGAVTTTADSEDFLNRWITGYCLGNPETASTEAKARKPLREARIAVQEVKGKPGCYEAIAHLRPHFQLDELSVALRLVTELPQPAQGG